MVTRLVTLMFVGLVLGLLLACALLQGFFEGWRALPSSPTHFVALPTFAEGKIFARTADGTSYSCSTWDEACWVQEPVPAVSERIAPEVVLPDRCGTGSVLRFRRAHPGRAVRNCLHYREMHVDGVTEGVFILDDTDQVWQRSHTHSVRDYRALFPLGLLFGLALGVVMVVLASIGHWIHKWQ